MEEHIFAVGYCGWEIEVDDIGLIELKWFWVSFQIEFDLAELVDAFS